MQLQHFFPWNKANIKHSCKSQLYTVQSFYCIFVWFNVRAVCESLVKNLWRSGFRVLTREYWLVKQATWEAHARIWRVIEKLVFASDSQLRLSHEWATKPTAYCFLECDFSHSLPTLYKPSLRTKCKKEYFLKKLLREKL